MIRLPNPPKVSAKATDAVVDGGHRRTFGRGNRDAVGVDAPAARLGRRASVPATGQSRVAAERPQGQGRGFSGRRSRRQVAQRRLQLLLGALQLAGQLRVEIAARIDVADEGAARLGRAVEGVLRACGFRRQRAQTAAALLEGPARACQLGERALACRDTVGVEFGEHAEDAGRLADLPDVGGRKQQSKVAALSHLIDVHQAGAQLRTACGFLLFEVVHPLAVGRELAGNLRRVGGELPDLFRLDLPIHLELPQVAQERAFFGRQAVGFLLQRLKPFGRALRERLGARVIGRLGLQHERQRRDQEKNAHLLTYRHAKVSQQHGGLSMTSGSWGTLVAR